MRRWAVPAVPFVFSLALTLPTAGTTVFWQDSGYYLTAIHEMSVPASHGFVLYLLLAKAWSIVWTPLVGFTLAVHLFSAVCAAGAASFLALAARGFLERILPAAPRDGPAVAAACVAAAGYSFWNAGTLAKAYALYYLTLAVLLWILVRAERRAHFFALGAVLGFAWAAHPSAAMLVPAMLAYAWARRDKVRELKPAGFAAVIGVAAVCAFVPSFVVLPILSGRESPVSLGDPRTPGQVWSHLRGANFTDFKGAWGFEPGRLLLAARIVWEEFLGVGLAVLGLGIWRLGKERPRVLALLGVWAAPMLLLPLVFIGEGMFDQWFVAAWLPLAFCTAAGFAWLAVRARVLFPGAVATAISWMILANYGDLNFRNYDLAQVYGRLILRGVSPGAIYIAHTDDGAVIPMYLQRVQGERPDVRILHGEFLGLDWYDRRIEKAYGVTPPKKEEIDAIAPRTVPQLLWVTAFANANVAPGRPVFSERPPDPRGLRPGLVQVPAGVLWKTAVEEEAAVDPKQWKDLPNPEDVARRKKRTRGILMRRTSEGMVATYEPYEDRLISLLVQAKLRQVEPNLAKNPTDVLRIYERVRKIDSSLEFDAAFQYNFGLALYLNERFDGAKEAFGKVLRLEPGPARETLTHFYLAEIARAARQPEEMKRHYDRALQIGAADPMMMMTIRKRASTP